MTDAAKAFVWQATYQPWGAVQALTGTAVLNARFPGQWFQLEAGLHYNWHRHYDPSTGRYTQPDPLGFVDGPSVYGYVKGQPLALIDPEGLGSTLCPPGQRPVRDERFTTATVITCVPDPSDPSPGCTDGSCVVFPPETNCACINQCVKRLTNDDTNKSLCKLLAKRAPKIVSVVIEPLVCTPYYAMQCTVECKGKCNLCAAK